VSDQDAQARADADALAEVQRKAARAEDDAHAAYMARHFPNTPLPPRAAEPDDRAAETAGRPSNDGGAREPAADTSEDDAHAAYMERHFGRRREGH
jgi:hypothetical protein